MSASPARLLLVASRSSKVSAPRVWAAKTAAASARLAVARAFGRCRRQQADGAAQRGEGVAGAEGDQAATAAPARGGGQPCRRRAGICQPAVTASPAPASKLTTPRQPRWVAVPPACQTGSTLTSCRVLGSLHALGKRGDGQGVRSSSARSRTGSMPYARSSAPAGLTAPMVQPGWVRCLRPRRPSGAPYGSSRSRSTP